jgi:hypothetical protein
MSWHRAGESGGSGGSKFGPFEFENVCVCDVCLVLVHRHTLTFRVLQHPKLESPD